MIEPADLAPEHLDQDHRRLIAELLRFKSLEELRRSESYRRIKPELHRILDHPRIYNAEGTRPRLQSFLRVVEWNIERGTMLEPIVEVLNTHPVLRWADLLLLNELDIGMVRSGNRDVALELSRALSAHVVFGAEYFELTKGTGDELKIEGENTTALHGNAIVTRHAVSEAQVIRLPRCENNFESAEKRVGGRIGIVIDLEAGEDRFTVANTHLDVVNSPRCRGRQMRALLQSIEARIGSSPPPGSLPSKVIVGGDLNTHTFARGGQLRAMKNTVLILGSSPSALERRLRDPQAHEPAIRALSRFGYELGDSNDENASSNSVVSKLDDSSRLPAPMKWWVNRRVGPEGLLLEFRLDWIAARGVRALRANEVTDEATGVSSINAVTVRGLSHEGRALSDHDPTVADIPLSTTHCEPFGNQSD